jgi:hypothetical protein
MKKKIVILSAALISLTAVVAFKTTSETLPVKEEKVVVNSVPGTGFALQDENQWK